MTEVSAFAGKYAAFIWPAYGACALAFAWMIVDTLARARYWRARAERSDEDSAV
jgi:heme exporter protein D